MVTRGDLSAKEFDALRRIPDELTPQANVGVEWNIIELLLRKGVVGISSGMGGGVWRLAEGRALVASAGAGEAVTSVSDEYLPQRCKDAVAAAVLDMWSDQQKLQAENEALRQQLADARAALEQVVNYQLPTKKQTNYSDVMMSILQIEYDNVRRIAAKALQAGESGEAG